MLFPSGSCNAACGYCFSSDGEAKGLMPYGIFERALDLYRKRQERDGEEARIVFHGGEPLLAGIDFYRRALPAIREAFGNRVRIGIQSNLWLLDEAFCDLFRAYGVSVGTSLDGDRRLNDAQRCEGYFDRTMRGIGLLRERGISFGCIATMAREALAAPPGEIMDFFIAEGIHFNVHVAVRPPGGKGPFLTEDESREALSALFDEYEEKRREVKVRLFDEMIRNVASRKPGLCVFTRCLGDYVAVAPDGELYPCNRFVGDREYSFGNVMAIEDLEDIARSRGWARVEAWFDRVAEACGGCSFKDICNGGCPYSGLSSEEGTRRDSACGAIKKIYSSILDRTSLATLDEAAGGADGAAAAARGDLLRIQRGSVHPYDLAQYAKTILASAALGRTGDVGAIAGFFADEGLARDRDRIETALSRLRDSILSPSRELANCYVHVTDACNLRCSFCYMGDSSAGGTELTLRKAVTVVRDAGELGFKKVVVTGGEPMAHGGFFELARELARLKQAGAAPILSLRTNLTRDLGEAEVALLCRAFDEIVASLDGDRQLHDGRRGSGSYDRVLGNLALFPRDEARSKLSLSTLFDYSKLEGAELAAQRDHVLRIRDRFGLRKAKFLPTKPLGRAAGIGDSPTERGAAIDIEEELERGYRPKASCGLGSSLMIRPDGDVFPCYALTDGAQRLGSVLESDLASVVRGDSFRRLRLRTVDADPRCGACALRYLCERKCLCWKRDDCGDSKRRAESLLDEACAILGIESAALEELG